MSRILIASSFSGFNVRAFTGKYPSEVAGAVLVDSVHEDQERYEPRATIAPVLPPSEACFAPQFHWQTESG